MTQVDTRPERTTPRFEDLAVGDAIPDLVKGPLTPAHLMRWSAAVENWHRIHYDAGFATGHDGLPERVVNGSFKQHVLVQLVRDWAGPAGWLWRIGFQFRGMDLVDDTLTAFGAIAGVREADGLGVVDLEIGLRNQRGELNTPGHATAVLPLEGGRPVPYPFVPPQEG
jgi:acyl dehydratase